MVDASVFTIFLYYKNYMLKCSIYDNINVSPSSSGGCDASLETNIGFEDEMYVFNRSDVEGLIFKDDSRPDNSLFVDTIITSQPYYIINASNISFNEEYEDHYYSQSITATISSSRNDVEEILQAAVHGRYLVAIRLIGGENYILVGWKEGLGMDSELAVSKEEYQYTISFTGLTTYPKMEADADNFDLSNKVFEPTFKALFDADNVVCDHGWATTKYVVKVNAAGQPLDEDNKLCQYSEKKQDAYKLEGAADGNYNILGTYSSGSYIQGISVKMYDPELCSVTGSISVSPTAITLNSTSYSAVSVTVTSNNQWDIITIPSFADVSRTDGYSGSTTVYFYSTEQCGQEAVIFRNRVSNQMTSLLVRNDRIGGLQDSYTMPNGTTQLTLSPITCGEYTVSTSEGTATINDDGTFTITGISASESEKEITITVTSGTETFPVTITILSSSTARHAKALSEWCEIE